mmetsp:Transcript_6135/g.16935  ORF Transcript_6135/g.16935 Transcript_6135/m.16935 type:complete len:94 (-) Transcript_6135:16-297(-)
MKMPAARSPSMNSWHGYRRNEPQKVVAFALHGGVCSNSRSDLNEDHMLSFPWEVTCLKVLHQKAKLLCSPRCIGACGLVDHQTAMHARCQLLP